MSCVDPRVSSSMATLLGVACVLYAHRHPPPVSTPSAKARHTASLIRSLGMALWPMVLFKLVPRRHHACIVPQGFLWVGGMWLLDEYLLFHKKIVEAATNDEQKEQEDAAAEAAQTPRRSTHHHHHHLPRSLRIDPSSVTALTFGLNSLLGVRGCENEHTHLFLTAVVGSLITTFVSHELPPGSEFAHTFENVQRVVLVWCIGLVLVAVQLTHDSSTR